MSWPLFSAPMVGQCCWPYRDKHLPMGEAGSHNITNLSFQTDAGRVQTQKMLEGWALNISLAIDRKVLIFPLPSYLPPSLPPSLQTPAAPHHPPTSTAGHPLLSALLPAPLLAGVPQRGSPLPAALQVTPFETSLLSKTLDANNYVPWEGSVRRVRDC